MMHSCDPSETQRRMRTRLSRSLSGSLSLAVVGCLLFPFESLAQDAEPAPPRVSILGLVYDGVTGTPVPGAAIYLWEENHGVLADSLGTFRFEDITAGAHAIAAIQFGYEEVHAAIEVPEDGTIVEIELTPKPIMLEGVTVVVENISTMERRLRTRRRATYSAARAFDQERMLRTTATNALDFLQSESGVRTVPCPGGLLNGPAPFRFPGLGWTGDRQIPGPMSSRCVLRRGRPVSPRVYIDEAPLIGGLDALESYPTAQIYLMEVYSFGGEIRAYTYNFMQRMAERPIALTPIGLWR